MKKQNFNTGWLFSAVGGEQAMKPVTLPHDAMLYEKRSKDAATAGVCGYFPGGAYVYIKRLPVPEEWREQSAVLEFEAVYQNAQVFVNGALAAEQRYGYTNFFVALEQYLKYGEENEIKVIADNSAVPNSRWYSGSGIYRNVNLFLGDRNHIIPDGLLISTSGNNMAHVKASVTGGDTVRVSILDGESIAAQAEVPVKDGTASVDIPVSQPRLWDADHPELYLCRTELLKDGEVVDTAEERFGFRTLSWSVKGFFVNGQETLLRGACIHHDNGILGACSFEAAELRRIRLLKEAGFNAIRSSHNPASKALLDACDQLGMYVMDEFCDNWLVHKNPYDYADKDFRAWWERDLTAMVIKNYNHPSVVMNSIGNEISELAIPEGQEYCKKLAVLARKLDPGKAVTLGVNLMLCSMSAKGGGIYGDKKDGKENRNGSQTMDNVPTSAFFNMLMNMAGGMIEKMAAKPAADNATKVCFSYLDIGGYNYAASRYEKDGTLHPDRVIVGSETLPKNLYHNWQLVKKLPYVIGDFMWTGWDYLGESGIGTVRYKSFKNPGQDAPIISGGCGVIDICGKLRPEVQWNRLTWGLDHTPGIGVEPYTHAGETGSVSMWRDTDAVASWSWAGCEGKRNKITVYSDGDTAELIINGRSYGKKKTKEYKAVFKHIAYEPGTITAISYDSAGKELSRTSMKTAEGASELRVAADRSALKAGTQDLAYLSIDLTGADGITKSSEDTAVTVEVSGAGELLALGSAKPNMGENFFSNTHTTYYGKALAVVRAGDAPGGITVTVRADGMQTRTVELNAI